MSFNGSEGKVVTLTEAEGWTHAFQNQASQGEVIAHFFGRDKIMKILDQKDCKGIRIYHGLESDGSKNLVLVGADKDGVDMTSGIIVEKGIKCPVTCDNTSALKK